MPGIGLFRFIGRAQLTPMLCAREVADSRCPTDMAPSMYLRVSPIFCVTSRYAFDITHVRLRRPCGNKANGTLKRKIGHNHKKNMTTFIIRRPVCRSAWRRTLSLTLLGEKKLITSFCTRVYSSSADRRGLRQRWALLAGLFLCLGLSGPLLTALAGCRLLLIKTTTFCL